VISTWSPIHLRTKLKELYWKSDKQTVKAADFWEDSLRYLYLSRLKSRGVLAQAIVKGAGTRDFFGTAYGEHDGKFDGFELGDANVQFDDTLLLIAPEFAKAYEVANAPVAPTGQTRSEPVQPAPNPPGPAPTSLVEPKPSVSKAKAFHASITINASTAKMRLVQVAEEIISVLTSDPNAQVNVVLEVQASFPEGASDQIKRAVTENANTLAFKPHWE
jgi:hypothetical protein